MSITANLNRLTYDAAQPAALQSLWSDHLLRFVDRYRWPLFAIMSLGYIAAFNGQWQIEADSALYLTLGRNVALGRGYTYHGQPHDLVYPGFPYALAGLFRIFQPAYVLFAADVMMILFGLAALALTYRLVLLYRDRPTAVLITLCLGISRVFVSYCNEIMTDIPFLMGTMAFLAGYEAILHTDSTRKDSSGKSRGRWYDWLLLGSGALIAISTRPTMIALVAIAMGVTLWRAFRGRHSRLWALLASGVVVVALAAFFIIDPRHANTFTRAPQSYETWAIYIFTHDLGVQSQSILFNLFDQEFYKQIVRSVFGMPGGLWWLNVIFGLAIVIAGLAIIRKRPLWGMWIAATFMVLLVVEPKDRYVLEVLPILMLAWWDGLCAATRMLQPHWGNWLFGILMFFLIAANLEQFGTIIYLQHREPFLTYYKHGKFQGYRAISSQINKNVPLDDLVLCPKTFARALTFMSDRPVVETGDPDVNVTGNNLWIVNDVGDPEFQHWLSSLGVHTTGYPVFSTDRRTPYPRPPVTLSHGEYVGTGQK